MKREASDIEAILKARAERLARVVPSADAVEPQRLVLTFRLAETVYAMDLSLAREVRPNRVVARVPCASDGLLGIVSVRGRLVPLFDLGRVLELPGVGGAAGGYVIVATDGNEELGLRVDSVEGMRKIAVRDIGPPVTGSTPVQCVDGVLQDGTVVFDGSVLVAAVAGGTSGDSREAEREGELS